MSRSCLILCVTGLLVVIVRLPLLAQFRAEVSYIEVNNKLMADVEVNGHKGRFLIDTGAPCCITHSFSEKLGINKSDTLQIQDSNGNLSQTRLVMLDSLKLGNVTFNSLQAMCLGKGNMVESFKIDGIIGNNLMRMGIVKLDSREHKLIFTNNDEDLGIDSIYGIPMVTDSRLVRIAVEIGHHSQDTVMFDCGASGFYSICRKSFARLQQAHGEMELLGKGKGILSLGAAGLGNASVKYRLKIPVFVLGKVAFKDVTSVTTDGVESRIGSDILKYGDVVIDYQKNMFYYIPFTPGCVTNVYKKEWDVIITVNNGHLIAGLVWDYTDSLLKGGERIVEINGRKYNKVDLYHATMDGLSMSGERAEIKYIDPVTGAVRGATLRRR